MVGTISGSLDRSYDKIETKHHTSLMILGTILLLFAVVKKTRFISSLIRSRAASLLKGQKQCSGCMQVAGCSLQLVPSSFDCSMTFSRRN